MQNPQTLLCQNDQCFDLNWEGAKTEEDELIQKCYAPQIKFNSRTGGTLELESILKQFSEIACGVARSHAVEVDSKARWPQEAMKMIQEKGLAGLVAPKETGGHGMGLLALAQACEILGRECTSTALCFGMHSVGTAVISAKATPQQKKEILEPISAGRHLTTLSLSEPGTGAHFYFPQTELHRMDNGNFKISGTKSFVTNGSHADSYVISTVVPDNDAPIGEFSMALVREGTPGMKWDATWNGFGVRGNSSRTLHLADVEIPPSHLLGEHGDQIWYVFEVVAPYFLMAMSGSYLGVAQAALDEAIEHLQTRSYSHSGSTLGQVPVLQHRIATLWAMVERSRQFLYSAARQGDQQDPKALPAILSVKADIAECATEVVNEAMTLMGGKAYAENSKMTRLLRDVRAAHVMAPTTDILKTFAGRALLGLPLLTD